MTGFIFGGGAGTTVTATGSTTARNLADRSAEVRNVKDFGAVGDGVADDTAAIQAAMNAAWLTGTTASGNGKGMKVFFPSGTYLTSAPLTNTSAAGGKIQLVGDNMETVTVGGSFTGYVVDNPDLAGISSNITVVSNMRIVNGNFAAGSGALRLGFTVGMLVDRCILQGFNALDMGSNAFNSIVSNCQITPNFNNQIPGTVGIYTGQNTIISCSIQGYDTGVMVGATSGGGDAGATGAVIIGCRIEVCTTAIFFGQNVLGHVTGASGTVCSLSTERCGTSIYLSYASPVSITGCILTGTVGPGRIISTTTWAANVATVNIGGGTGQTLNDYGWTSGTRNVAIQSNSVAGYNVADGSFVVGTYVNSTRFTYPLLSNPGGSGTGGLWSFQQQYGIRVGTCSGVSISGVSAQPLAEIGRIHMGSMDASQISFNGVITADSTTWVMPPGAKKAGVSLIACDNPALGMAFADLPGQAGVKLTTPRQGDTYYITDGNQATAGNNVTAGGGANKSWVVYNGTNWIRGAA